MKSNFCIILFLLSIGTSVSFGEDFSRISILSLLRATRILLTLKSPATCSLVQENAQAVLTSSLLKDSVLPVEFVNGSLSIQTQPAQKASIRCPGGCQVLIGVPGKIERYYHGDWDLYPYNNTINIVLIVRKEELVASIVSSEMGEYREPEALKGFAILVRTFLMAGSRHSERNADFCDTTHCQVFQGFPPQGQFLNAARATVGLVLTYHGQVFQPFYSKSCGGKTATFEQTWNRPSKDYPFYSVDCPFCRRNNGNGWQSNVPIEALQQATGLSLDRIRRSDGWIHVSGATVQAEYTPENFRILLGREMGWKFLPGNEFEIIQNRDSVFFTGKGRGHGVGFCQTGSAGLAHEGKTFQQILSYYFPNTELNDGKKW